MLIAGDRMNLPNYFIADLPPEAVLTSSLVTEACQALKQNRERYLAHRPTSMLIGTLCAVGQSWLSRGNHFRTRALEQSGSIGFSRETLATGLDSFFKQLTPELFNALLEQDLGHSLRLDKLAIASPEERTNRAAIVTAPELVAQIGASTLPVSVLQTMVLAVLLRSAQFVKCATGTALVPRLFAHSLYEADPKLGACIEIAEWRGGSQELEQALFAETDCLVVSGVDETVAAVRQRLAARTRLVAHGHRVSFAFVAGRALTRFGLGKVATRAAQDVAAWNQLGCLSPHVIYVENSGEVSPEEFAEKLAQELAAREAVDPRGPLPINLSATIASRRAFYEMRAAHSPNTRVWASPGSTAWTVVYEEDPRFQASCLNRFVYVKGVRDLEEALQGADPVRGCVSTIGVAAPEDQAPELALSMARWGATRVCPLGQMQSPSLLWRHDGRPALADLVTWTDFELP
jgi:hypothetical protein